MGEDVRTALLVHDNWCLRPPTLFNEGLPILS